VRVFICVGVCLLLTLAFLSFSPLGKSDLIKRDEKQEELTGNMPPVSEIIVVYDPDIDRVPSGASGWDANDLYLYIKEQCQKVGVDHLFVYSLLREENPTFFRILEGTNPAGWMPDVFNAVSPKNDDGTRDYGLWQLNGQYLWDDYIPRFWHGKVEFDYANPYHNTYIAVRHISWLKDTLARHHDFKQPVHAIYWETALAYNAGIGRVLSERVPSEKTVEYAANVMSRLFQ